MQKYVKSDVAYVTWPNFIILGPLYISGMDKDRDFNFSSLVWIDRQACKPKNAKLGQKARGLRQVTYVYNFVTPYYSYRTVELTNKKCGA